MLGTKARHEHVPILTVYRSYFGGHPWMLVRYAIIAFGVSQFLTPFEFYEIVGIVIGCGLGYWLLGWAMRALLFRAWGKREISNLFYAILKENGMPKPDTGYELGETYFVDTMYDEGATRQQVMIACGWRGIFHFIRGTQPGQLLFHWDAGLIGALESYRAEFAKNERLDILSQPFSGSQPE